MDSSSAIFLIIAIEVFAWIITFISKKCKPLARILFFFKRGRVKFDDSSFSSIDTSKFKDESNSLLSSSDDMYYNPSYSAHPVNIHYKYPEE